MEQGIIRMLTKTSPAMMVKVKSYFQQLWFLNSPGDLFPIPVSLSRWYRLEITSLFKTHSHDCHQFFIVARLMFPSSSALPNVQKIYFPNIFR